METRAAFRKNRAIRAEVQPALYRAAEARLSLRNPRSARRARASFRGGRQGARLCEERSMEYRQLGGSGLSFPALTFGTATFGGGNVAHLQDNLAATQVQLTAEHIAGLDAASAVQPS